MAGAGDIASQSATAAVDDADDADDVAISPVQRRDRIVTLDFIRGIAVMGILGANIIAFGQPFDAYLHPNAFLVGHGPVSDWLLVIQYVLIDNKMRGLFTLLFGAGLYLFMERAWARGATLWLQAWRLLMLLVFGLLHFFVLWRGDILTCYALIGLIALPLLRLSATTKLGLGLAGYFAGIILHAGLTFPYLVAETSFGEQAQFAQTRVELAAGKAQALAASAAEGQLIEAGDFSGLVTHRLAEHATDPVTNALFFLLETLPLILIGAAVYRMGFFSGVPERGTMLRWGWAGILAGGAISLAQALWLKASGFTYYAMIAGYIGWNALPQLLMTLGYAALLIVFAQTGNGWVFDRVAAAGRAAFTNYIGTSVLMMTIFHGWGLGLFGELHRPALYGVMVIAWIVMLSWSKPWLDHHAYGPLEWLWRCLTYRRMFAIRR